jgi:DNA polymerase III alpha subunit (gram-positive type)
MNEHYPGYKHFFLDVETTGLDSRLNNIFQISGVLTDAQLNPIETVDWRFRPLSLEQVESDALMKTGMTLESLGALPLSANEVYTKLIDVLQRHCDRFDKKDKLHFVAYNAKFDVDFIRAFFEKNEDNYFGSWFWNPPICVMQAAAWMTMRVRGALPNFKLGTLCQCAELGWDEAAAHDASYDIRKTLELYQYLRRDIPQL